MNLNVNNKELEEYIEKLNNLYLQNQSKLKEKNKKTFFKEVLEDKKEHKFLNKYIYQILQNMLSDNPFYKFKEEITSTNKEIRINALLLLEEKYEKKQDVEKKIKYIEENINSDEFVKDLIKSIDFYSENYFLNKDILKGTRESLEYYLEQDQKALEMIKKYSEEDLREIHTIIKDFVLFNDINLEKIVSVPFEELIKKKETLLSALKNQKITKEKYEYIINNNPNKNEVLKNIIIPNQEEKYNSALSKYDEGKLFLNIQTPIKVWRMLDLLKIKEEIYLSEDLLSKRLQKEIQGFKNYKIIKKTKKGPKDNRKHKYETLIKLNETSKISEASEKILQVAYFMMNNSNLNINNEEFDDKTIQSIFESTPTEDVTNAIREIYLLFTTDYPLSEPSKQELKIINKVEGVTIPIYKLITEVPSSPLEVYLSETNDCLTMKVDKKDKYTLEAQNILKNEKSNFLLLNAYLCNARVKFDLSTDLYSSNYNVNIAKVILLQGKMNSKKIMYCAGVSGESYLHIFSDWKNTLDEGIQTYTKIFPEIKGIFYDLNPQSADIKNHFAHEWSKYISEKYDLKLDKDFSYDIENKKETNKFRLIKPKWNKIKFERSKDLEGKFFLEGVQQQPRNKTKEEFEKTGVDLVHDKGFVSGIYVPIEALK